MSGRPLKFKSPEELENKIQEYYKWCEDNKKHITITGLAWYLDTNRLTLLNYESENSNTLKSVDNDVKLEFINTIKRAKAKIESEYEESLYNKNSAVGAIFTLKNNFKYVDKQEIETTNKDIRVELTE